jgi:hypothetical protein
MPIATYSPVKGTQAYPIDELRAHDMILALRKPQKLSRRMAFTLPRTWHGSASSPPEWGSMSVVWKCDVLSLKSIEEICLLIFLSSSSFLWIAIPIYKDYSTFNFRKNMTFFELSILVRFYEVLITVMTKSSIFLAILL